MKSGRLPSRPALRRGGLALGGGYVLGGDGAHSDGRDRDRGAEPHQQGRGNAGPEQALGQREHQHQDRARTGADADGQDRGKAASPATGAGEFARRGAVGMAAMLVVNVVMLVVMMGLGVIVAMMIVRIVMVVTEIMMVMRHARDRRHRLNRLQRTDESAGLDPDQAQAEQ